MHEIEYSMRDQRSDELLASARERVFDWGTLPFLRRVMFVGAVDAHEACGYAGREPHPFRPAGLAAHIPEDYRQADMALVESIIQP